MDCRHPNPALAAMPPQYTPSEASHWLLHANRCLGDRRPSAFCPPMSAFNNPGTVKLREPLSKARGLPVDLAALTISREAATMPDYKPYEINNIEKEYFR